MNRFCTTSFFRFFALALGLQLGSISVSFAQSFIRNDRLSIRDEISTDQVIRQSHKESKNYESDYKATHLNTDAYSYKTAKSPKKARNATSVTRKHQKTWKVKRGIKHR